MKFQDGQRVVVIQGAVNEVVTVVGNPKIGTYWYRENPFDKEEKREEGLFYEIVTRSHEHSWVLEHWIRELTLEEALREG